MLIPGNETLEADAAPSPAMAPADSPAPTPPSPVPSPSPPPPPPKGPCTYTVQSGDFLFGIADVSTQPPAVCMPALWLVELAAATSVTAGGLPPLALLLPGPTSFQLKPTPYPTPSSQNPKLRKKKI